MGPQSKDGRQSQAATVAPNFSEPGHMVASSNSFDKFTTVQQHDNYRKDSSFIGRRTAAELPSRNLYAT